MDRIEMKNEAKNKLNSHFRFFFILFLPVFILLFIRELLGESIGPSLISVEGTLNVNSDYYKFINLNNLLSFISLIITAGIMFVCIDVIRNKDNFEKPFVKSTTVFSKGQYFMGSLLINILTLIFTMLWMILLIVPGIVKSFSYSQAIYIYRDAIDNNQKISYLDAITKSRQLMDGHKSELFVLYLSFIGWGLLVLITGGIAGIWVIPYMNLTLAQFYQNLLDQNDSFNNGSGNSQEDSIEED